MKHIFFCGLISVLAMMFAACGDEVTKVTEVTSTGVPVIEAGEDLPVCESEAKGHMVFLEDSLEVYYCSGEEWLPVKGKNGTSGKDGQSCSVKKNNDGFTVLCGEDSVGVLQNGSDGENGLSGSDGRDGKSCSVTETSTGFDVYCGEEKVGILSNGKDGPSGSSGPKGDDCSLIDHGNGTVTQKCGEDEVTIYKALCGTTPYDPAGSKFCYGVTLYDKCNGKAYDVNTESCSEE